MSARRHGLTAAVCRRHRFIRRKILGARVRVLPGPRYICRIRHRGPSHDASGSCAAGGAVAWVCPACRSAPRRRRRRTRRRARMRAGRLRRPVSRRPISPPTPRSRSRRVGTSTTASCPDYSADALQARDRASAACARATSAAFDGAQLGEAARFERDYLRGRDRRATLLARGGAVAAAQPGVLPRRPRPGSVSQQAVRAARERMRAYIAYARAIPRVAAQIRANLRTPMPGRVDRIRSERVRRLCGFLRERRRGDLCVRQGRRPAGGSPDGQYGCRGGDARARRLAGEPARDRDQRFRDRRSALQPHARSDRAGPAPARASRRNRPRGSRAQHRGAARLPAGSCCRSGTVAECVARVRSHKAADGPVALARRQLPELEAFVRQSDIVTIPSDERALVASAPPYNAQNFAYIIVPGPYETNVPATYYIAPPDPRWTPEQRAQYVLPDASMLFTSVHEVWPGHFLQFLHSNRCHSRVGQLFTGYAFVEGWAHYAEETDVGRRSACRRSRGARRTAAAGALARRALRVGDRAAHRHADGGRFGAPVPRAGMARCGQCASAGAARRLRSRVPQLHARQAHDPQAA